MAGRARIGPRRPLRIYLAEWREDRGLTQKQLGARLEPPVSDMTVSRWEKAARGQRGEGTAQMNDDVKAALAEALDIAPQDLYRDPKQPSADELLRDAPAGIRSQAFRVLEALTGKKAVGER